MIALILSIFYALYFFYLYKWVQHRLLDEYNFCSPLPRKTFPHCSTLSIFLGIVWGLFIFAGILWGFTYNPYPEYFSIKNSDTEMWLLIALCIALSLTFIVVYHLGEIKGITSMKNTKLFKEYIDNQAENKKDSGGLQ